MCPCEYTARVEGRSRLGEQPGTGEPAGQRAVAHAILLGGRQLGDDLREGKPTLPLLIAMERGTAQQRALVRNAIVHGEISRLAEVVEIVRVTGALTATRDAARTEADKACTMLELLPATAHRDALLDLSIRSVERSS